MSLIALTLLLLTHRSCHARDYSFEVDVSMIPFSGTVDEVFYRLCNNKDVCGLFQSVPAGWQSTGTSYSYTYSTPTNIGEIYKVQIVHPGSDMLCIDHIKVDGIEYDENGESWIDWPHCIEEADGGGCDTVTIILPDNDWSSVLTIPCEYESILRATLSPTPSPTKSPIPPPTNVPTTQPTSIPTYVPTDDPTNRPSISPTTKQPTDSPSRKPTKQPSNEPTASPTNSASGNVADGEVGDNSGLTNSDREDGNGMVMGLVIGLLGGAVLCLCLGIILLCYCRKREKKMNDGVEEINHAKSVDAQSTVSDQPSPSPVGIPIEGATTTTRGTGTNTGGGYMMASQGMMGVYDEGEDVDDNLVSAMVGSQEDVQLMGGDDDDTDEEADEGLYDNDRRNMTQKRNIVITEDSLVEDEDVIPN